MGDNEMTTSFDSVFSSAPFKFLVGSDKKPFTVHSALIAHHSKPLNVLVNGDMSEAKEGCAFLDGVDEQTFARFSQYAYTGDYVASDSKTRQSLSKETSTIWDPPFPPDERLAHYPFMHSPSAYVPPKYRKKKSIRFANLDPPVVDQQPRDSKLWNSFKDKVYDISNSAFKLCEIYDDNNDIFMCHARMYAFADRYDIAHLRCLSLHKLQQTLITATFEDKRMDDIVDLIDFTYSNTASLSESTDDLRLLVSHYAACVIEELAQDAVFCSVLESHGAFGKDIVKQMVERLVET